MNWKLSQTWNCRQMVIPFNILKRSFLYHLISTVLQRGWLPVKFTFLLYIISLPLMIAFMAIFVVLQIVWARSSEFGGHLQSQNQCVPSFSKNFNNLFSIALLPFFLFKKILRFQDAHVKTFYPIFNVSQPYFYIFH